MLNTLLHSEQVRRPEMRRTSSRVAHVEQHHRVERRAEVDHELGERFRPASACAESRRG